MVAYHLQRHCIDRHTHEEIVGAHLEKTTRDTCVAIEFKVYFRSKDTA